MAHTTQILYRVNLPGGGYSNTGVAKNNKTLVAARVVCTDVQSGLETFTSTDLGLAVIDVIFPIITGSGTNAVPAKSATTSVHIDYDFANTRFVMCDVAAAGDRTAITNDEDPIITVIAVGSGSIAPDLT